MGVELADDDVIRLREYIEALFAEKDRALQMAADEREKSAQVLREEQHRAMTVAEREREKAAAALRDSLAQAIAEGDKGLREHIANQIAQIKDALKSAELLENERIRGVRDELTQMINANTREFRQIQAAGQTAVEKAEEAQLRVNEGQNEFRGQLRDQAATLMPRRESEARHDETTRQMRELRDDIGKLRTEMAIGPAGLSELARDQASTQGRDEAKGAFMGTIIAVVVAIAAVGLVVVELATRGH